MPCGPAAGSKKIKWSKDSEKPPSDVSACLMTSSDDSDGDGDDVVFLSPLEEASQPDQPDQGASPQLPLRRSTRKCKSTAG